MFVEYTNSAWWNLFVFGGRFPIHFGAECLYPAPLWLLHWYLTNSLINKRTHFVFPLSQRLAPWYCLLTIKVDVWPMPVHYSGDTPLTRWSPWDMTVWDSRTGIPFACNVSQVSSRLYKQLHSYHTIRIKLACASNAPCCTPLGLQIIISLCKQCSLLHSIRTSACQFFFWNCFGKGILPLALCASFLDVLDNFLTNCQGTSKDILSYSRKTA